MLLSFACFHCVCFASFFHRYYVDLTVLLQQGREADAQDKVDTVL